MVFLFMNIKYPTQCELIKTRGVIYLITNTVTNKNYIGRAKNGFWERYVDGSWWKHTSNYLLRMDAGKYGIDKFKIEILNKDILENDLDNWEDYAVELYDCLYPKGYNLVPGGNTKKHTDVICDKLSCAGRGSAFVLIKDHRKNIIHKVINVARFSREMNLSHDAMKRVASGKSRQHKSYSLPLSSILQWELVSPYNDIITIYEGEMRSFCRKNNLNHGSMKRVITGLQQNHRGWSCPYALLSDNTVYLRSPIDSIYAIGLRFVEKFARLNRLNPIFIRKLTNGEILHYLGWTLAANGVGFCSVPLCDSLIDFSCRDYGSDKIFNKHIITTDQFSKILKTKNLESLK